ncbi:MAG: hypothetical protein WKF94_14415 [Solirubrobacteraceae bacterium]
MIASGPLGSIERDPLGYGRILVEPWWLGDTKARAEAHDLGNVAAQVHVAAQRHAHDVSVDAVEFVFGHDPEPTFLIARRLVWTSSSGGANGVEWDVVCRVGGRAPVERGRCAAVVMKWMTRGWQCGDVSDAEGAALEAEYQSHVERLLPRLPDALRVFVGQPDESGYVSLHDGRLEWWASDAPRSFTLQVFCGYDRLGYRRLVMQYRGRAEVFGASGRDVAGWLNDPQTELLYDEVDIAEDGRFEHRFLLWPAGEFGLRCDDVVVVSAPAPASTYEVLMRRKQLESSAVFGRLMHTWETGQRRMRDLWEDLRARLDDLR